MDRRRFLKAAAAMVAAATASRLARDMMDEAIIAPIDPDGISGEICIPIDDENRTAWIKSQFGINEYQVVEVEVSRAIDDMFYPAPTGKVTAVMVGHDPEKIIGRVTKIDIDESKGEARISLVGNFKPVEYQETVSRELRRKWRRI